MSLLVTRLDVTMEKSEKKSKKNVILIAILIVLSVLLLAFIVISPYVVAMNVYKKQAENKIDAATESVFKSAKSSIVYDKDENELAIFRSDLDKYYVYSENIPEAAKYAFVMLVDEDFYNQEGAGFTTLLNIVRDDRKASKKVSGVSGITRYIARDMFLSYDIEQDNALIEVFVANELEERYTKEELFEFYVNNLYFNNGFYGIEAAARGYFSKELSELSVAQICFLAAIAEEPELDPYDETDMETIMDKKEFIIEKLYAGEYIDSAAYFSALGEELLMLSLKPLPYNYAESYMVHCVVRGLMANEGFVFRYSFENADEREGYMEEYERLYTYHYKSLYTEGYRIYTSFDLDMQDKLQSYVDQEINKDDLMTGDGALALQGAAVCIDNKTGLVTAIVGGRDVNTSEYAFNRGFEGFYTAGKIITPLNVYTPYIEWHHNPDYIVYREEAVDGTFINQVTLREAILAYDDRFATKVYGELTPTYALTVLDRIGFTKAVSASREDDGYGDVQVSVLELATGYATFARDGQYMPADCIVKVTNDKGGTIYEYSPEVVNAYASNDSRIMREILAHNVNEGLLKNYKLENAIAAGMYSYSGQGGLFAGFSDYYTVAAYTGYEGISLADVTKDTLDTVSLSGNVWKNFMEDIHEELELVEFAKPGPYSPEPEPDVEILQPTTERPSLGGEGGHPEDGDDYLKGGTIAQ